MTLALASQLSLGVLVDRRVETPRLSLPLGTRETRRRLLKLGPCKICLLIDISD